MAQLPQTSNTEGNEEKSGFTPIPAGRYVGAIVKSEMKQTKAKDGNYLDLQVKIMEGEYKGRIIFEKLNLVNKNPVAVEIANKKLNTYCEACDLRGVEDSEELHGIDMGVQVGIQKANADWPASNNIVNAVSLHESKDGLPWE